MRERYYACKLTNSGFLLLKAITSAMVRTGEDTSSFKYAFNDILNSANNAVSSPLAL